MFILKLKIRQPNSKIVANSSGIKIGNKKNSRNGNNNGKGKKFRKLTKSKNKNLTKSRKITKNSATKIRLNFLIFGVNKTFN